MEIKISDQLICIFLALLLGIAFGVIYDALKAIRSILNNKITLTFLKSRLYQKSYRGIGYVIEPIKKEKLEKIKLFFWDILYFIIITPLTLIFIYATSFGIVRWYIFASLFIGFVFYYVLFSKITKYLYEPIIFLLILTKEYIKLPFKGLFNIIKQRIRSNKQKSKKKPKKSKIKEEKREILISYGKSI